MKQKKYVVPILLCGISAAGLHVKTQPEDQLPSAHGFTVEASVTDRAEVSPVPKIPASREHGRASFTVKVGDLASPFNIVSRPVLQGEQVPIEIDSLPDSIVPVSFTAAATNGTLREQGVNRWHWTAPESAGVSTVRINQPTDGSEVLVNFLVMEPYSAMGRRTLNGYPIGQYPAKPLKNNPVYSRPDGFVEVTPDNENLRISPHFQLKQFLCKQPSGYPKYLVLNERLVLKLELILEEINRNGIAADTLHVMSGYRTPAYNAGLGNVKFSMHQFGKAADVFVDQNRDGNMDDLNGDHRINERDAGVLSSIVEQMDRSAEHREFVGGLGRYDRTQSHGPFVHVDVRGYGARW